MISEKVAKPVHWWQLPGRHFTLLHRTERDSVALTQHQHHVAARIRWLGIAGSVLLAVSSLGAGALPAGSNFSASTPVINIFTRAHDATVGLSMLGMVLLVFSWLSLAPLVQGQRDRSDNLHRISRQYLDRIILSWIIPIAFAVPVFSTDVYSYLAHGAIVEKTGAPYSGGPLDILGAQHPLAVSVPDIWASTPNQYGPVFVGIEHAVYLVAGDNVVAGLALHRVLAVCSVLAMVWAVPRLAQRCRVSDVAALWLAVANPLTIFHLIGGIHSESVMLGFLAVGMELCLRGCRRILSLTDGLSMSSDSLKALGIFCVGTVCVSCSALVKIPSLTALGFMAIALGLTLDIRTPGRRVYHLLVGAALTTGMFLATVAASMALTGSGFGWITKLGAATEIRSWISPSTALGMMSSRIGERLGMGDHSVAVIHLLHILGGIIAMLWVIRMLLATWGKRIHPVGAAGIAIFGIVICFPVVHPWYVLWALIPLAAWANDRLFRRTTVIVSAFLAVFTLPPGYGLPPTETIHGWIMVVVTVSVIAYITWVYPGLFRIRSSNLPKLEQ